MQTLQKQTPVQPGSFKLARTSARIARRLASRTATVSIWWDRLLNPKPNYLTPVNAGPIAGLPDSTHGGCTALAGLAANHPQSTGQADGALGATLHDARSQTTRQTPHVLHLTLTPNPTKVINARHTHKNQPTRCDVTRMVRRRPASAERSLGVLIPRWRPDNRCYKSNHGGGQHCGQPTDTNGLQPSLDGRRAPEAMEQYLQRPAHPPMPRQTQAQTHAAERRRGHAGPTNPAAL